MQKKTRLLVILIIPPKGQKKQDANVVNTSHPAIRDLVCSLLLFIRVMVVAVALSWCGFCSVISTMRVLRFRFLRLWLSVLVPRASWSFTFAGTPLLLVTSLE